LVSLIGLGLAKVMQRYSSEHCDYEVGRKDMTESSQITEELVDAFETASFEEVQALVQQGLDQGADPGFLVNDGMIPGIRAVGDQFRRGEVYLPEMMMAADAFQEAMDILQPIIATAGTQRETPGTIVIATVKGDIHALGKNIVVTMLKTEGFNVIDAGVDIPASKIIDEAEKWNAEVIALSALMTTTMPQQKEVIEHLKARGTREQYYVMVGGGPTDANWAEKIGADGYGETAADAVAMALAHMEQRRGVAS
jgi:corrinoid protein of di/trimethylamine methyltransferase